MASYKIVFKEGTIREGIEKILSEIGYYEYLEKVYENKKQTEIRKPEFVFAIS